MATIPVLSQPEITISNGRAVTTSFAVAEYFASDTITYCAPLQILNAQRNLTPSILRTLPTPTPKASNAQCTKSPKTDSFSW